MNYYNENDPFAAAWLRELIKANLIASGDVDERSIEDVRPSEIIGYTQCHFFAGIGGWPYALRLAGWPDTRSAWTGSCPCQPFSTAGKRSGTSDERHLWPAFFHLIEQCKPPVVFGEQVEAAIRQGWLDLVQDDMEGIGYTFAAAGLPAASVGAPHLRARLYFVADSNGQQEFTSTTSRLHSELSQCREMGNLADSASLRCLERRDAETIEVQGDGTVRARQHEESEHTGIVSRRPEGLCGAGALDDTTSTRRERSVTDSEGEARNETRLPLSGERCAWSDCDWLYCRDEKYRPVESGTFPLAHGISNRVGKLRGYGNAIVAPLAQAFIESYLETEVSC